MTAAFDPPLRFGWPLLPDLSKINQRFEPLWRDGMVTKGSLTEQYEEAASDYLRVAKAVAVSSCTTGLVLALRALKVNGECLVPSFTFSSTVQALLWNNLKPVFADCHAARFTVSENDLNAALTRDTACVVVPYIFGNPPPLDEIETFCREKKLALVLDAAHAFGSLYRGKQPGGYGNAEVFSTSATKLLCTGEGGLITTRDPRFAQAVSLLREYGHDSGYEAQGQGLNGRLTEFQSCMGLEGIPLLEAHAKRRNELAACYKKALQDLPVSFQEIEPDSRSSYKDFAILLNDDWPKSRDETQIDLEKEGIPTRKYFPPAHKQKFFQERSGGKTELSETEKIAARILCLPIFYHLKESEIETIGNVFRKIAGAVRA